MMIISFFAVIIVFNVVSLTTGRANPTTIYFAILFFPFLFLIYFWQIYKRAKSSAQRNKETVEFRFLNSNYEVETTTTKVQNAWSNLHKIVEIESSFIIMPHPNLVQPIPKRFFRDEQQIAEFRKLITSKLGEKAQIK